jgi:hypothetical protein
VSTLAAVRRGLSALFFVHALRSGWALLLLGPVYDELSHALASSVFTASATPGDAALALEAVARSAPHALPTAAFWLGAYALLGPWLQQVILHGLDGVAGRAALVHALRRYPAALAVRALAVVLFVATAALTVVVLEAALALLPPSAPLELCARLACGACVAACALWLASAHDLALAAIAHGRPAPAAVWDARRRCTSSALALHLLALSAAVALALLAELAGRVPLALPYATGPIAVLLVQQALLFAALLARATWLARTLASS